MLQAIGKRRYCHWERACGKLPTILYQGFRNVTRMRRLSSFAFLRKCERCAAVERKFPVFWQHGDSLRSICGELCSRCRVLPMWFVRGQARVPETKSRQETAVIRS